MNERIRELFNQAGLFCYDDGTVSLLVGGAASQREIEKLADLIVTKCAVIATRCESNGTKNIGAEILEHFGVE